MTAMRVATPPDRSSGPAVVAATVAVVAVRTAVTAGAVLVGVTALAQRDQLAARAVWIAVLAGLVVVAVWGVRRRRSTAAVTAAVAWAAATRLVATAVGRDRRGLAARVLATDLPPRALYALALAAGLCGVGCLVLAAVSWWAGRRRRPLLPPEAAAGEAGEDRDPRGAGSRAPWVPAAAGVAAGVLVAGLALPVTLAGGDGWRAAADRQAEDDARLHTVRRPAERQRPSAGPVQPSDRLWDVPLPAQSLDRDYTGDEVSMTAVPGWDVVLVSQLLERPTVNRLVALSLADGEVLWRYERRGLFVTTVDPGSGRVALVADGAVVVLSLRDGEEVTAQALPTRLSGMSCATNVHDGGLGDWWDIRIGPTALVACTGDDVVPETAVAVVAVASGRVVAMERAPAGVECSPWAATGRLPAVLVRSGGDCGPPTLLGVDAGGGLVEIAEIPPPAGVDPECTTCLVNVVTGEDTAVAWVWGQRPVDWDPEADCETSHNCVDVVELVAFSRDGELRWQLPVDVDVHLVAVTDQGVITRDSGSWRLLSLADGSELIRTPAGGDGSLPDARSPVYDGEVRVVDGERLYAVGAGSVRVLRLDDLSPVGTWDVAPSFTREDELYVSAAGGRLVCLIRDEQRRAHVVAYGDGAGPGAPGVPGVSR